jgi:CDGSH-type Zn-finger protein
MSDADRPLCPQARPYVIEEQPGKKAWCACGRSQRQPYCDGSHRVCSLRPVVVEIEKTRHVAWCGCKLTKTPPFCDGSHSRAPRV